MKNKLKKKISLLFSTLRSRLLAWFFSFFFLVIFGLLITFSLFYYFSFKTQVDHHLTLVMNEAQQIISSYHPYQRDDLLRDLVGSEAMTIVLLSSDGSTVLQTNSPDVALVSEHQLLQIISQQNQSGGNRLNSFFSTNNTRFISSKYVGSDGEGYIAVGYSMNFVDEVFKNYMISVVFFSFLFIILFGYFSYWFLKKQLSPLEEISSFANKIKTSTDLSQRAKVPQTDILELQEITSALEKMIGELQKIFTNERNFFSDTAHIIKTPLSVLRTEIERLHISSTRKNYLLKTVDTIVHLVTDLLYISKIQSEPLKKKERVSITDLLYDFYELSESLAQKKAITVIDKIGKSIFVKANKNFLNKAIGNIVMNAIDYTPRNGSIIFEAYYSEDKKYVHIKISNSGSYIPHQYRESIFDRFYQASSQSKSRFGLGLAATKAVIDKLEGQIKVLSQKKVGTCFHITLPR